MYPPPQLKVVKENVKAMEVATSGLGTRKYDTGIYDDLKLF